MIYVSVVFSSVFKSKVIGKFGLIINLYPFRAEFFTLLGLDILRILFLPHQLMMNSKFKARLTDFDTLAIFTVLVQ
jgi:hypothetical protein